MSISDAQKVDLLYKKVAGGVSKTDVSSAKSLSGETIPSSLLVMGSDVWTQGHLIPPTPPADTTAVVQRKTRGRAIECTSDTTASPNRTWLTNLKDWIPPSVGALYQVKVTIGDPGMDGTGGVRLFPDGSGNNDAWFFDYQSGVLNFIGDNIPNGVAGNTIYVQGYRYIGTKGDFTPSSSDVVTEGSTNLYYTAARANLKADKVGGAVENNLVSFDNSGNLKDSGYSAASLIGPKYIHNQSQASKIWAIAHGLGYKPRVQVFTSAGTLVEGSETHMDENNLTLGFSVIVSGVAYLF